MKLVILIALIALAAATPVEDKKTNDDQKVSEKSENKKPAADEKKVVKPEEKKNEEHKGLQWPLPDPINEGDLMLHGAHILDRVEELRKKKLDNDMDKMIVSVGREYLRRVHEYVKKTTDFKILPDLCRDSERLNSTKRWEIRLRPIAEIPRVRPNRATPTDGKSEKQIAKDTHQNDPIVPFNTTHENATDNVNVTTENGTMNLVENFETRREDHYERMGENFARVLLKRYRKEKLEKEESEYLERWVSDESVHYGMMGIYCHNGENIKEITKRIKTVVDEKH